MKIKPTPSKPIPKNRDMHITDDDDVDVMNRVDSDVVDDQPDEFEEEMGSLNAMDAIKASKKVNSSKGRLPKRVPAPAKNDKVRTIKGPTSGKDI